jgi:hypothetical protein
VTISSDQLNLTNETTISTQAPNSRIIEQLVRMNDIITKSNDIAAAWTDHDIWSINIEIYVALAAFIVWWWHPLSSKKVTDFAFSCARAAGRNFAKCMRCDARAFCVYCCATARAARAARATTDAAAVARAAGGAAAVARAAAALDAVAVAEAAAEAVAEAVAEAAAAEAAAEAPAEAAAEDADNEGDIEQGGRSGKNPNADTPHEGTHARGCG